MYCSMFVLLCLVCIQRKRFTCMLQVFFSVFSVSLWQNYSATYWSGVYTTSFCFGFVCTQIFLEMREKKVGKALGSCRWALNLLWKQLVTSSSTVSLDTILYQPVILGDSLGTAILNRDRITSLRFFLDIDECKLFHNGPAGRLCLHACVNTAGGYRCSCPAGYSVTPDGRNCKGHSWIAQHALRIPNSQICFWPFCFCSQISTSAAAGRTTAHTSSSASTRTEASSASQSSVRRYATPPTSKHLQCE